MPDVVVTLGHDVFASAKELADVHCGGDVGAWLADAALLLTDKEGWQVRHGEWLRDEGLKAEGGMDG